MGILVIYVESPIGPLANRIIDGYPALANNWGFGVEGGRPYFDTGMATRGQHGYLELMAPQRVAIVVAGRELFGREFTGMPLRANPPNVAKGREFTGMPLRANPPNVAKGREFTGMPLRANPPNDQTIPVPRKPPQRDGTGPYQRSR